MTPNSTASRMNMTQRTGLMYSYTCLAVMIAENCHIADPVTLDFDDNDNFVVAVDNVEVVDNQLEAFCNSLSEGILVEGQEHTVKMIYVQGYARKEVLARRTPGKAEIIESNDTTEETYYKPTLVFEVDFGEVRYTSSVFFSARQKLLHELKETVQFFPTGSIQYPNWRNLSLLYTETNEYFTHNNVLDTEDMVEVIIPDRVYAVRASLVAPFNMLYSYTCMPFNSELIRWITDTFNWKNTGYHDILFKLDTRLFDVDIENGCVIASDTNKKLVTNLIEHFIAEVITKKTGTDVLDFMEKHSDYGVVGLFDHALSELDVNQHLFHHWTHYHCGQKQDKPPTLASINWREPFLIVYDVTDEAKLERMVKRIIAPSVFVVEKLSASHPLIPRAQHVLSFAELKRDQRRYSYNFNYWD